MEALIYAPTAHALMWSMAESHRSMIADVLRVAQPLRAFTIYARVRIDPGFGALSIVRLHADQPLPFFDALERPLPLVTRLCEFWYPHLTSLIRPERHPRQARPDTLVVWGPPRAPLPPSATVFPSMIRALVTAWGARSGELIVRGTGDAGVTRPRISVRRSRWLNWLHSSMLHEVFSPTDFGKVRNCAWVLSSVEKVKTHYTSIKDFFILFGYYHY
jgi:hypothetical protein